jgi:hypothetical protein
MQSDTFVRFVLCQQKSIDKQFINSPDHHFSNSITSDLNCDAQHLYLPIAVKNVLCSHHI